MRYWILEFGYAEYRFCTTNEIDLTCFSKGYNEYSEDKKKYIDKIFKTFDLEIRDNWRFEIYENAPQIIDFSE